MKMTFLSLFIALVPLPSASGQGLIRFVNSNATLISSSLDGGPIAPSTSGATYFFAVLLAPPGTTDPTAFVFSALYGTNTSSAGRIQGGSLLGIAMNNWATDQVMNYEIAGWSGNLGPTWNPAWLVSRPTGLDQYFGLSTIGTGAAGPLPGSDPGPVPFSLFGASPAISGGFTLTAVPEPTMTALIGVAVAALAIGRRSK